GGGHLYSLDGGQDNSLADATIPPGMPSPFLEPVSKGSMREMISWLHSAMDVLQAAADSADFFDRAARAVVDTVALDAARVLLRVNGEWKTKTVQTARQADLEASAASESSLPLADARRGAIRKPSESVLEKVLQHKRTLWEALGTDSQLSESLSGV